MELGSVDIRINQKYRKAQNLAPMITKTNVKKSAFERFTKSLSCMTISGIQTDSPQFSEYNRRTRDSSVSVGSDVDFLEKYINQLSIEKDLLQRNAESCLALLDLHIRKLAVERDLIMGHLCSLSRQSGMFGQRQSDLGAVPFVSLSRFLDGSDVFKLSATSKEIYEQCRPDSRVIMTHLKTPTDYMSFPEALVLVESLCVNMVETLFIDAKKSSGKALLCALSNRSSELRSLKVLRISAAAETGDFLIHLERFMNNLPENQISSIHFSGLRSISLVSRLIQRQRLSIEQFKVDYFVNGHESDVDEIPIMPRLRSFVYDVADVVHLPVSRISSVLEAIIDKPAVETIYLPHMQISGPSNEIVDFIDLMKTFNNVGQMVVRFRRLPLSVREIVSLREAFENLPAVCISDHFIVMLDSWATWWPKQSSIWPSADKITGLSVFREQIDFESLGTTANREWLRLTREQKNLWSRRIAPNVVTLYLKTSTV